MDAARRQLSSLHIPPSHTLYYYSANVNRLRPTVEDRDGARRAAEHALTEAAVAAAALQAALAARGAPLPQALAAAAASIERAMQQGNVRLALLLSVVEVRFGLVVD